MCGCSRKQPATKTRWQKCCQSKHRSAHHTGQNVRVFALLVCPRCNIAHYHSHSPSHRPYHETKHEGMHGDISTDARRKNSLHQPLQHLTYLHHSNAPRCFRSS